MIAKKLFVGIDWGTHSSKWWYSASEGISVDSTEMQPTVLSRVIDSTVYRTDDALFISRERTKTSSSSQDARLKRRLLDDPMGPNFWVAVRAAIGVSLGEAAVLTICCMLSDLHSSLSAAAIELTAQTEISLRFSLPNWTENDPENEAARKRMYQATVIACCLLQHRGWGALPEMGKPNPIAPWRQLIKEIREEPETRALMNSVPASFSETVEKEYKVGDLRWRLAAESSAAGFTSIKYVLREVPKQANVQKHWVKLLVVDVGAGSTDSEYFVSSREIKSGNLVFNYLPPAVTLNYAGEDLTKMLQTHFRRQRKILTMDEAETMKVSAPDQWIKESFVDEWRNKLAHSVGEYMRSVPDERRLPEELIPGLKIVLTGGSGIVKGLDLAIKSAVCDALMDRGISASVSQRTELVTLRSPITDRVDAARRAVSTGAAQSDFAKLRYLAGFEKFDPSPVRAPRSWV